MNPTSEIESSPLQPRKANVIDDNVQKPNLEEYRAKSEEDMRARYVKSGNPAEFLHVLLPFHPRTNVRPPCKKNPFEGMKDADDWAEPKVVEEFVKILEAQNLCPKLVFCRSESRPHSKETDETAQRIDGGFFRRSEAPKDGRPHWELQLVPVEFKNRKDGDKYDPFADGSEGEVYLVDAVLEPQAESRRDVRQQIISYADKVYAMQHRTFVFMLLVMGRRFRLIRWDRSGAIVTNAIDYYENPEPLCDFLWRISYVKHIALGIDPTATRISPGSADYKTMADIAKDTTRDLPYHTRSLPPNYKLPEGCWFKYIREMFAESMKNRDWPCYKLEVAYNGKIYYFLVGRPCFLARGLAGRGTRGYVAYDVANDRLVWLKDTWRASYDLLEKEGDILLRLNNAKLSSDIHVPTLVCHGDVPNQATLTADWWEHKHPILSEVDASRTAPPSDPPRRSSQVCMLLKKFTCGRQLVSVVYDCLSTHEQVAAELGLLHRDISDGNILMYPKIEKQETGLSLVWRGYLIDWEAAKPIAPHNACFVVRQPERSGPWHFLSANLINNPSKPVVIADELESLLHVLIYYAIRYLHSSITPDDEVAKFLDATYDSYVVHDGAVHCGERKGSIVADLGKLVLWQPKQSRNVAIVFNSPMDMLISRLLRSFKARYDVMNAEELGVGAAETGVQHLAERLRTHEWMRTALDAAIGDHWNLLDKVGDRVPKGWKCSKRPVPSTTPGRQ
ncbi:hypothetical protein BD309DRAFT_929911 [Dichomitus squalens]|nr:hypothetical protein BD309DRAFT_929911 [Dichomitus squalens]